MDLSKIPIHIFTENTGKYQYSVKEEYAKQQGYRLQYINYQKLIADYNLVENLHNTKGPAVLDLESDYKEYWVNGKIITDPKEIEIMLNYYNFNNKFNEFLK